MLVDLGRNDLGRVCEYGTRRGRDLHGGRDLLPRDAHRLVGRRARCAPDVGAMDALRSMLPAGTLSGAPKVRAMQIIDELEPVKRGGYGGAIGYLSYAGDLDTCIHIRTVVVKDGVAHVQAGGGTVADAKPDYEYEESRRQGPRRARGDRARRSRSRTGHDRARPRRRQLRLVHLQPRPVPGRAGAPRSRSCATTAPTVDELLERGYDRVVVSPGPVHAQRGRHLARGRAPLPRGGHPDARRLPRPPVAGPGLRRARRAPRAGARQDDRRSSTTAARSSRACDTR